MSRRTAIVEEEFDDDVDLPLPARPLPNLGTHGAILEEIGADGNRLDEEEDEEDAPPLLAPQPTAGPASPTSKGPPVVTDITPYKQYVLPSTSSHSRVSQPSDWDLESAGAGGAGHRLSVDRYAAVSGRVKRVVERMVRLAGS
ncbi:hypothetical protein EWM64_g5691 [Hericium alpestre]|uniref:Uncharacterized protein n=1 Tax=Hericium alpestre TaxID=135208 RepID=A0A4Y9ZVX6_9AGAM|nr:hypothetical protein EWM64_g5691 [Hericium alpestre]